MFSTNNSSSSNSSKNNKEEAEDSCPCSMDHEPSVKDRLLAVLSGQGIKQDWEPNAVSMVSLLDRLETSEGLQYQGLMHSTELTELLQKLIVLFIDEKSTPTTTISGWCGKREREEEDEEKKEEKKAKARTEQLNKNVKERQHMQEVMAFMFATDIIVECTGELDDDDHDCSTDLACMDPQFSWLMEISNYKRSESEEKLTLATLVRSAVEIDEWECKISNIILVLDQSRIAQISVNNPFVERVMYKLYASSLVSKDSLFKIHYDDIKELISEFSVETLQKAYFELVEPGKDHLEPNMALVFGEVSLIENSEPSTFTVIPSSGSPAITYTNFLGHMNFEDEDMEWDPELIIRYANATWFFVEKEEEEEEEDEDEEVDVVEEEEEDEEVDVEEEEDEEVDVEEEEDEEEEEEEEEEDRRKKGFPMVFGLPFAYAKRTICIDSVMFEWSVLELKAVIAKRMDVNASRLSLISLGEELADHSSCRELERIDRIFVVLRPIKST